MNRYDIYSSIRKAGYTQAEIARRLRLPPSVVGDVVADRRRSRRVALEISSVTKIPVARLWPGRYPDLELAEIRTGRVAA
jgi:lambda repressor-like predicted transcriptional regulator